MNNLYQKIEKLTKLSRGFQSAFVLITAVRSGLFDLLDSEKSLGPLDVAEKLGYDPRATAIFLHALAGMDILEKRNDGSFANAEIADELLVRGRKYYQGDILAHTGNLIERWSKLPEVLKTGRPAKQEFSPDDGELLKNFIMGMSNIARLSAEKIAESLDLSYSRKMLDLGGGPGTYAITFCELNPGMEAVVFDRPEVIDRITKGQIEKSGLSDSVTTLGGDYLRDSYKSGYDLVLVSNIIHSLGPERNRDLLLNCRKSMIKGGRIVVKDFLLDDSRVQPRFSSMFAVNMLVGTDEGNCYTIEEVKQWLTECGFTSPELIDLSPQSRMLVAKK